MDSVTDKVRSEVETELQDLYPKRDQVNTDISRLEGVLKALDREVRKGTRRRSGNGSSREAEFLATVRDHPGIKVSDAAREMGMNNPNYLYKLKARLEENHTLREGENGELFLRETPAADESEPTEATTS